MFSTIICLIRIAFFMLSKNRERRLALKADRLGDIAERDRIVNSVVPVWARHVFSLCRSEVEVEGLEKLPADKAVVFVANHQGMMDIPLLYGYTGKPMAFVAKAELGKIPVLAAWMRLLQCTFIERKSPRKSMQAIHDAAANVSRGYSQVIFPEGTRSRGGPHHEFKAGSFKLAFMSKSPIVPVTIDGTWRIYEDKKKLVPSRVKMIIHDPIETDGLSREELSKIPPMVEQIVCSALPAPEKTAEEAK